jgi:hypothetical protein
MDPRKFHFPVVTLDGDGRPEFLRGNAFPITPDGDLMTCRHVVSAPEGTTLAILDNEIGVIRPIGSITLPADDALDLAFLPRALNRASKQFPILPTDRLLVGEDVSTYGFYAQAGRWSSESDGYFKGNVVTFRSLRYITMTLSYPVIEGLSGSPVTTAHNGRKLVGVCFGSESQRVLAAEVVDVQEGDQRYRETVNRIVELGLAYRSEVVEGFLTELGITNHVVTDMTFDPGELS